MPETIWKYPVGADTFSLELPEGAQVLDAQLQNDKVQMWALVNPDADKVVREFVTYGTGHPIASSENLTYIASFQVGGWMIFHLFEVNSR